MNTPKLRFKEFSEEWETQSLGDMSERVMTKNKENNKNVLTISAQLGLVSQLEYYNKSVSAKDLTGYYLINKNDFAYNKSYSNGYPMGAIKRLEKYDKGVVSTLYICFRNNEKFDTNFAVQYFESGLHNKQIELYAQEGARNHGLLNIGVSDFFSTELKLPSLPEQEKIASFFTAVDKKLTLLKEKKEKLETYKKGVMQQIFSQKLRFKDDQGKSFPEWEEKTLGEIVTKHSSSLSANTIENNTGNYPVYGASGLIKNIDFFSISEPYISIVKDGAGVGRLLLCPKDSSVLGTLDIIKTNKKNNLNFVYYLMMQIDFGKYKIGSTIPHIYFRDYSKVKVGIPQIQEQQKIANFLTAIDNKIELVNQQISQIELWKKGLLQKMFV